MYGGMFTFWNWSCFAGKSISDSLTHHLNFYKITSILGSIIPWKINIFPILDQLQNHKNLSKYPSIPWKLNILSNSTQNLSFNQGNNPSKSQPQSSKSPVKSILYNSHATKNFEIYRSHNFISQHLELKYYTNSRDLSWMSYFYVQKSHLPIKYRNIS